MSIEEEVLKDATGGGVVVLILFVVWKIIEEVFRYRGTQIHKRAVESIQTSAPGTSCAAGQKHECRWSTDDHGWLMELRDYTRDLKKEQEEIRDSNKDIARNIQALGKEISQLNNALRILANGVQKEARALEHVAKDR